MLTDRARSVLTRAFRMSPILPRAPSGRPLAIRPAHALYFATYEAAKSTLGGDREGHHPVAVAAAGSVATLVNDAAMTPVDVIKQRLQVGDTPCTRAAVAAVTDVRVDAMFSAVVVAVALLIAAG